MPTPRHLRTMLLALAGISACSDSTAPPPPPPTGLLIIATPPTQDTIGARPVQALVVEVRDTAGVPQVGITARFESPPRAVAPGDCCQFPTMFVSQLDGTFPSPMIADTTNAEGRAAILVYFGAKAGPGSIIVTVPELGLLDTVTFTIDPGAPMHLIMVPPDTAIMTGGSIARPRPTVIDRNFNERDDSVSLTTVGSLLTAETGGGFRSGSETGLAMIIGALGAFRDTMTVSVVPAGVLAAYQYWTPNGIVVANTDGSDRQFLTAASMGYQMGAPEWSVDGQSVIHPRQVSSAGYLYSTALDGATRPLSPSAVSEAGWPSASTDGQWVYFSGIGGNTYHLWRIHPDGSQLESMSAQNAGLEWRPGISRNGNLLAFVGDGPTIHVRDLSSGNTISTGHFGQVPHFSPVDDRIAFLAGSGNGAIALMNPDGTNLQMLTTTTDYGESLDWSPDGNWIVAQRQSRMVLIEVATGLELPLPWSGGLTQPSWRP